jgi:hypothetical protein
MQHSNGGRDFQDAAAEHIQTMYPSASIERDKRFPQTERRADVVAVRKTPTGVVRYIVETAHDFAGMCSAIGQLAMYAGHYDDGHNIPVLAYPKSTAPEPETDILDDGAPRVHMLAIDSRSGNR